VEQRPFEAVGEEPVLEVDAEGYDAAVGVVGVVERVGGDGGDGASFGSDVFGEVLGGGSVAVDLYGAVGLYGAGGLGGAVGHGGGGAGMLWGCGLLAGIGCLNTLSCGAVGGCVVRCVE